MTDDESHGSQGVQGVQGIQGVHGIPSVDASIASQLSAVNVTLQFLMRDIQTMKAEHTENDRRIDERERRSEEREARTDERVARIEQAIEKLSNWQKELLESTKKKQDRRSTTLTLVIAGWAVAVLGGIGWLVETLLRHLQWRP